MCFLLSLTLSLSLPLLILYIYCNLFCDLLLKSPARMQANYISIFNFAFCLYEFFTGMTRSLFTFCLRLKLTFPYHTFEREKTKQKHTRTHSSSNYRLFYRFENLSWQNISQESDWCRKSPLWLMDYLYLYIYTVAIPLLVRIHFSPVYCVCVCVSVFLSV